MPEPTVQASSQASSDVLARHVALSKTIERFGISQSFLCRRTALLEELKPTVYKSVSTDQLCRYLRQDSSVARMPHGRGRKRKNPSTQSGSPRDPRDLYGRALTTLEAVLPAPAKLYYKSLIESKESEFLANVQEEWGWDDLDVRQA